MSTILSLSFSSLITIIIFVSIYHCIFIITLNKWELSKNKLLKYIEILGLIISIISISFILIIQLKNIIPIFDSLYIYNKSLFSNVGDSLTDIYHLFSDTANNTPTNSNSKDSSNVSVSFTANSLNLRADAGIAAGVYAGLRVGATIGGSPAVRTATAATLAFAGGTATALAQVTRNLAANSQNSTTTGSSSNKNNGTNSSVITSPIENSENVFSKIFDNGNITEIMLYGLRAIMIILAL